MENGGKVILRILIITFLIVDATSLSGQIRNKFDIHFKYGFSNIISDVDKSYTFETAGIEFPTILGNLNNISGFEVGFLYSDFSYYIQPGIVYSHTRYNGNASLQQILDGFQITSNFAGIQCKINLMKYGYHQFTPYFQATFGYVLSNVTYNSTIYTANIWMNNSEVYYTIDLNFYKKNISAINPELDLSIGTEVLLTDRIYLLGETGLRLKNQPDYCITSPLLLKEFFVCLGLKCKFLKDKRYMLR